MSSDARPGDGVTVPLSAEAFQVASLAAEQVGVPTADWVALAVLAAAAEQSGLGGDGTGTVGEATGPSAPDGIAEALTRLEAKLDAALARENGPGHPAS